MLKKKWQNAICSVLTRSLLARAARMPVVVVPMFEPRVRGYILSILITPTPTSGVILEVNTELLCTTIVSPQPTRMARYPGNKGEKC